MRAEIKKAGAVTPTKNNKLHNKSYLTTAPLSSPKEQIGELLLVMLAGNVPADGWQRLEQLLSQYYGGVS